MKTNRALTALTGPFSKTRVTLGIAINNSDADADPDLAAKTGG